MPSRDLNALIVVLGTVAIATVAIPVVLVVGALGWLWWEACHQGSCRETEAGSEPSDRYLAVALREPWQRLMGLEHGSTVLVARRPNGGRLTMVLAGDVDEAARASRDAARGQEAAGERCRTRRATKGDAASIVMTVCEHPGRRPHPRQWAVAAIGWPQTNAVLTYSGPAVPTLRADLEALIWSMRWTGDQVGG